MKADLDAIVSKSLYQHFQTIAAPTPIHLESNYVPSDDPCYVIRYDGMDVDGPWGSHYYYTLSLDILVQVKKTGYSLEDAISKIRAGFTRCLSITEKDGSHYVTLNLNSLIETNRFQNLPGSNVGSGLQFATLSASYKGIK